MNNEKKLRTEIRALKETCEILADRVAMAQIRKSLEEIQKGKYITPSKL